VGMIALILMPGLATSALSQTSEPVQFVFAFNHDVSVQLGSTTIDATERRRRFAALVDGGLDLDAIGERLLGWRWTRVTSADRQAFRREFRNYLIQNFAMRITGGVDDGRVAAASILKDESTVLVLTEITTKEAARVPFAWRVVHTADGWRLCDVVVNNVSMASIMGSQFASVLQDTATDIGPLLHLLREKSAR
jgi:ABC-type transporter MlaC component